MTPRFSREPYHVAFYVPWMGPLLTRDVVPPTGGAETQVYLVARELARRGLRVCVIVFAVPGAEISPVVDHVHVLVRPAYRARRRLVGKILEAVRIRQALRAVESNVIVTRAAGPHVGLVAVFAKLAQRRFVYSSANISDFNFAWLAPKRRDQWLFRLGVRLADRVVVQTDEQVELCRRTFGREAERIGSIAEPGGPPAVPEAFLWIGRMVWYKRPLAFVDLARALPHASFRLVGVPVSGAHGGEELIAALKEAAASTPNLDLIPPCPRRDLSDLTRRAVAMVNTADFEGMPNVFLEGWAHGVPALALTHDPDGVIERHRLGGFARGSTRRLVELADELWRQRDNRAELSARCRDYVAVHHAPGPVGARWEAVLDARPPAETSRPLNERA
ncbi:MAG TPA: glycosyltransferase family 4 protein [Gaiellaceae bacterium]|nr:glycosyltransferase family 4 protein [Gaiellaceae bacterium]